MGLTKEILILKLAIKFFIVPGHHPDTFDKIDFKNVVNIIAIRLFIPQFTHKSSQIRGISHQQPTL